MRKILLLLLCFSVCPVFAQNAIPFCMGMTTRVNVTTRMTVPKYITTYSKEEFLRKVKYKTSPYTVGLTDYALAVDTKTVPSIERSFDQICVGISELNVELYYPEINVYIDKKYAPSSCESQVIKSHEGYHVAVAEKALPFYRRDVERVAQKALERLYPKIVYSEKEIEPTVTRMAETVMDALKPVIKYINKKLAEKNAAIDTPEMYKATRKQCRNW